VLLVSHFVQAKMLVDIQRFLLSELRKHLGVLGVEGTVVNNQLLRQNLFANVVLRNHPFDCTINNSVWILFDKTAHIVFFQTTSVLSVMSVQLLIHLTARDK